MAGDFDPRSAVRGLNYLTPTNCDRTMVAVALRLRLPGGSSSTSHTDEMRIHDLHPVVEGYRLATTS